MSEFKYRYKFQWIVKGQGLKTAYFYADNKVDAKRQFQDLYRFEPTSALVTITRSGS